MPGEPRPYTSKRRRRCGYAGLCTHGGTIRPGDTVVRQSPHLYVHEDDGATVVDAYARMVDAIRTLSEQLPKMLATMAESMSRCITAAVEAVTAALVGGDALPIDVRPDDCWRCDAARAVDIVGLCGSCRDDLVARVE